MLIFTAIYKKLYPNKEGIIKSCASMTNLNKGRWSKEEDKQLKELYKIVEENQNAKLTGIKA